MGGLFSSPKAPPPPPPPPPPTPLPVPEDDVEIRKARRRKIAEQRNRSGRASTILTRGGGNTETLGG